MKHNVILYEGEVILFKSIFKEMSFKGFRLDIFYNFYESNLIMVLELLINDTSPNKSKILNYVTAVSISDGSKPEGEELKSFVRECKFFFLDDFKTKIDEMINKNFSDFVYKDLQSPISYFDNINYVDPTDYIEYLKIAPFKEISVTYA